MTRSEFAALSLLSALGALALDTGMADEMRSRFEDRFGVVIDTRVVSSAIKKLSRALEAGGEQVLYRDEEGE